ncbi:hypothetical protein [Nitratifractor sp.]
MPPLIRKILRFFAYLAVFVFIVFEEFIWEGIARPLVEYLCGLRIFVWLEKGIGHLPAPLILVVFIALFVSVEMAGVAAGILLVKGFFLPAIALYGLKIPIAGFTFWLFGVSREKLLVYGWFRWSYERIVALFEWIKSTEIYRKSLRFLHILKEWIKRSLHRIRQSIAREGGGFGQTLRALYRHIRERIRHNRLQ